LQFYADFAGTGGDSHYLRLSGEETWEYHSPFAIEYYYDGQLNKVDPPDSSLLVCWSTKPVSSVFTLATDNLVSNSFKMFPLHLADNTTTKLYIGYYLKVTLHSLSREAYDYWEQLRVNLNNQDGLYETQPLPVSGNVKNLTRPGKKVLGFFQASGISQKVIFIDGLKDLDISMEQGCGPYPLGRMGWREYTPASYPVYLVQVNRAVLIVDKNCVDCRQYGGNTVKPEFWPR